MKDHSAFERIVADSLSSIGAPAPSEVALERAILRASRTRQRPQWLALIKEPPMRVSSSLAAGSPAARVTAVLVATLLLAILVAGAGIAGSRLLAADDPIIVDQSGGADFTTLTDAVAAAGPGATILVRPGTYIEALTIAGDITVTGDGPLEDIVITAPEGGPTAPLDPSVVADRIVPVEDQYAVLLQDSRATLSNLTFRGERSGVIVSGGAPTLEGLAFDGVGEAWNAVPFDFYELGSSIVVNRGSAAVIRSNSFTGGGPISIYGASEPLLESNRLAGGPHIWGDPGNGAIIRDNAIEGSFRGLGPFGIEIAASPTIEANTVAGTTVGIELLSGSPIVRDNRISGAVTGVYVDGSGTAPVVEGNLITDSTDAAIIVRQAAPTIAGNVLRDNATAISWVAPSGLVERNETSGGRGGIRIGAGAPTVTQNTVRDVQGPGVWIGAPAQPTLSGNIVCDNSVNLSIVSGASL